MKISVNLIGTALARSDRLINDVRHRVLERLQDRIAARAEISRAGRTPKKRQSSPTPPVTR